MSYAYEGSELPLFAEARNWKRYLARLLRPHVRGRVLEVGAGMGATTQALWNPDVAHWTCVEPDPSLAEHLARLRLGSSAPDVVVGDLRAVAAERRFDTVLYVDVLEHIDDDVSEVERAAALLAAAGRLVIVAPAFMWLYSAFDRAIGHRRRYTLNSLRALFGPPWQELLGQYADAAGLPLLLLNRWLGRQPAPTRRVVVLWDRLLVPLSLVLDPLVGRRVGRSVIGVFARR